MLFAPTPAAVLVHVATPATNARLTQPAMLTPPSLKVTVPVGVGPTPVTTAVKVTDWPKLEGFVEDVTVVVDGDAAAADTIPREKTVMFSAMAKSAGPQRHLEEFKRMTGFRLSRSQFGLIVTVTG